MISHAVWDHLAKIDETLGFSQLIPTRTNRVVMYHSVGDPDLFGNVSPDRLDAELAYLTSQHEVVDLPVALADESGGKVALTFDDAFMNFYTDAYPVLQRYNVPATVYVVSDAIDKDGPEPALDPSVTMNESQLRSLVEDDSVTLGNHTRTHQRLSKIDDDRLHSEVVESRLALEERFGISVDRFCYPHGSIGDASARMVQDTHRSSLVVGRRQWWFDPGTTHEVTRVRGHDPRHEFRWKLTGASRLVAQAARRGGLRSGGVT